MGRELFSRYLRRLELSQEQQKVLEYLQEENRVLKAQLGQRLRLSDEERRRLSAKGKELGRKLLNSVAAIPTRPSRPPSFVERVVDTRVNVKVERDPSGLQISLELSHHVGVHEAVVLGEKAENRSLL